MRGKLFALALIAAALVPASQAAADGRTLLVDDDKVQCPNAQFTTIQSAVTAAPRNSTVLVCPGTYTEQVRIETDAKDGLKLVSKEPLQAIIKSPTTLPFPKAIVLVEGADNVDVQEFTITGPFDEPACGVPIPGSDPSNPVIDTHKGVYVKNAFHAEISRNHITLIRNSVPALFGCQDGISVQVGRAGEQAVGTAKVFKNVIDEYQKGGIVVDNAGSYAMVMHNKVEAAEEVQPNIAPNGIQVSRGAGAFVQMNTVSRNQFLGDRNFGSGSGILLFQPGAGKVHVVVNETFDNDDGLPLLDADNEKILANYSHDNVFFDGLYADSDSTGNLFAGNTALRNAEHDCHDDSVGDGTAGTANKWEGNTGNTGTPAGICKPESSGGGGSGLTASRTAVRVSPADAPVKALTVGRLLR